MSKSKVTVNGNFVKIEEVEPDYDQDPGYRVTWHENDMMPPFKSEFVATEEEANKLYRQTQ